MLNTPSSTHLLREILMSKTARRSSALALLFSAALLSACADSTGPSVERAGSTANQTCETQGSNTQC